MRAIAFFLMISIPVQILPGCVRQEKRQPGPEPGRAARIDEALPPERFASGWKATPGSYIYSASPDELWKIYDGAAPGMVNEGAREAVTQGYENTEGGADKSLRIFVLRFVDQAHALAYLKKEIEGATGGEKLDAVDAGQIFAKAKAPWARFVVGPYAVSVNWEGSSDDTDNAALEVVRNVVGKLARMKAERA